MRKMILSCLLLALTFTSFAQEEDGERKGFRRENLFFGGNFGLMFGTNTLINVSPQVGYRFSNLFSAGVGINGQYLNQRVFYTNGAEAGRWRQGVVGLNIFGRVNPIDQIMIQVQPEANYLFGNETLYGRNPETTKLDAVIVPSLLIGGGLVLPSGRGAMIVSVFYDVLQRERSPYQNRPIYNFGYNFGF
jgi:hypothetical protein